MSASGEPATKKQKLSDEELNIVKECSMTGICLNNYTSLKWKLLLPTIYPLNNSRSKNIICGLKLDYLSQEVEPVIGIVDQYYKGVILSEGSWKCLTESFEQIQEFFNCTNAKKWNECLRKPIEHPGFSIIFNYITCGYSKSKVVCFDQKDSDAEEESKLNYGGFTSTMQPNTFNVLCETEPIISEYLIFLKSVIPCVRECITTMIEFGKTSVAKQNVNNFLVGMNKEVVKHIGRNSLHNSEYMKTIANKFEELNNNIFMANYRRIMHELYVFHSDFLIYYMYDSLALTE